MTSETQVLEFAESDVQYITWSPTGHGVTWVRNNDLYYIDDVSKYPTGMVRITHDGSKNQILNGLPDWVYEGRCLFVCLLVSLIKPVVFNFFGFLHPANNKKILRHPQSNLRAFTSHSTYRYYGIIISIYRCFGIIISTYRCNGLVNNVQ